MEMRLRHRLGGEAAVRDPKVRGAERKLVEDVGHRPSMAIAEKGRTQAESRTSLADELKQIELARRNAIWIKGLAKAAKEGAKRVGRKIKETTVELAGGMIAKLQKIEGPERKKINSPTLRQETPEVNMQIVGGESFVRNAVTKTGGVLRMSKSFGRGTEGLLGGQLAGLRNRVRRVVERNVEKIVKAVTGAPKIEDGLVM